MRDLIKTLALGFSLALAGPALSQEAVPATGDLSLGETGDELGTTYVKEAHGDWELRCVRTGEENDPCQLYQLLKDGEGNSVAEISLFGLPEGQEAAAGATIITPLETLLTQSLRLQIDSGQVKTYPFTWCAPIGCVSRVGFTAEEVANFRKGVKATLTIVPVAAPDKQVNLAISLKGFTAGFEAVVAANAARAAAVPAPAAP